MPKKSFKNNINPAMQFISNPAEEVTTEETTSTAPPVPSEAVTPEITGKPPAGYKLNPLYVETRSKRLQLLIQPSVYDKLKSKSQKEGKSVNDIVNTILQEALREE